MKCSIFNINFCLEPPRIHWICNWTRWNFIIQQILSMACHGSIWDMATWLYLCAFLLEYGIHCDQIVSPLDLERKMKTMINMSMENFSVLHKNWWICQQTYPKNIARKTHFQISLWMTFSPKNFWNVFLQRFQSIPRCLVDDRAIWLFAIRLTF